MKKLLFAVLTTALSSQLMAGTITINGISNLKHVVEFVSIRASVQSRCYLDPEAASAESLRVAQALKAKMQEHLDRGGVARDELILSDDSISLGDSYDGGQMICKQSWISQRNLVLRTAYLSGLSRLKADLLAYMKANSPSQNLVIALREPDPALYPETVEKLEKEGIQSAALDASEKFKALAQVCEMSEPVLNKVTKAAAVVRDYSDGNVAPGDSLGFEFQYIHQAWDFTWKFKNTKGLCSVGTPELN